MAVKSGTDRPWYILPVIVAARFFVPLAFGPIFGLVAMRPALKASAST